jgi:hypothetical protein
VRHFSRAQSVEKSVALDRRISTVIQPQIAVHVQFAENGMDDQDRKGGLPQFMLDTSTRGTLIPLMIEPSSKAQ